MSLRRFQRGVRQMGNFAGGTSRLARPPAVLEEPDVRPGAPAAGCFSAVAEAQTLNADSPTSPQWTSPILGGNTTMVGLAPAIIDDSQPFYSIHIVLEGVDYEGAVISSTWRVSVGDLTFDFFSQPEGTLTFDVSTDLTGAGTAPYEVYVFTTTEPGFSTGIDSGTIEICAGQAG